MFYVDQSACVARSEASGDAKSFELHDLYKNVPEVGDDESQSIDEGEVGEGSSVREQRSGHSIRPRRFSFFFYACITHLLTKNVLMIFCFFTPFGFLHPFCPYIPGVYTVYIYIYIYIYTCFRTDIYMYIPVYIPVYIYICFQGNTQMGVLTYSYERLSFNELLQYPVLTPHLHNSFRFRFISIN